MSEMPYRLFDWRAEAGAQSHAAEAESRNYQIVLSEFALLHCFSFERFELSKRCHIDDKAILHVAFQKPFVSLIDLLNRDQFDIGGDAALGTKVEHLLGFADPADS